MVRDLNGPQAESSPASWRAAWRACFVCLRGSMRIGGRASRVRRAAAPSTSTSVTRTTTTAFSAARGARRVMRRVPPDGAVHPGRREKDHPAERLIRFSAAIIAEARLDRLDPNRVRSREESVNACARRRWRAAASRRRPACARGPAGGPASARRLELERVADRGAHGLPSRPAAREVVGELHPCCHGGCLRHEPPHARGTTGASRRRTSRSDSTSSNQAYTSESTPRSRCSGTLQLEPALDVRSWVPATPVRGAGAGRASLRREVGVDRVTLDACALRNRRDGRSCWTDRRVEPDLLPRRSAASSRPTSRAFLQLVLPLHCTTVYLATPQRAKAPLISRYTKMCNERS